MISRLLHIGLIILFSFLQIGVVYKLGWFTPQLILAGILALSLTGDVIDTIWWAALGGALLDLVVGELAGFRLIFFGIAGGALSYAVRQFLHRPSLPVAFFLFLAISLLYELVAAILGNQLSFIILAPAAATALVATGFYLLLIRLGRNREVIYVG